MLQSSVQPCVRPALILWSDGQTHGIVQVSNRMSRNVVSPLVSLHSDLRQGVRGSPPKATPSRFGSALFVFRDIHLALYATHHPPAFAQSKTKTIPWQGFSRQNDTHYALKHGGLSLVMRPAVGLIRQSYPAYAVPPATTKLLWQAWYPHSAPYSRTFASLSRDW